MMSRNVHQWLPEYQSGTLKESIYNMISGTDKKRLLLLHYYYPGIHELATGYQQVPR